MSINSFFLCDHNRSIIPDCTWINNLGAAVFLPIKPLPTTVTKTHKFTLQRDFTAWTNIISCIRKNHQLRYEHGDMKLGKLQNET